MNLENYTLWQLVDLYHGGGIKKVFYTYKQFEFDPMPSIPPLVGICEGRGISPQNCVLRITAVISEEIPLLEKESK